VVEKLSAAAVDRIEAAGGLACTAQYTDGKGGRRLAKRAKRDIRKAQRKMQRARWKVRRSRAARALPAPCREEMLVRLRDRAADLGALSRDLPGCCGNGVVDEKAGEVCDLGVGNSDTRADACRTDCRTARCGDGTVDSGEECDGALVDVTCSDLMGAAEGEVVCSDCRFNTTGCTPEGCGDGQTAPAAGELCDDGNLMDGDGCDRNCTPTGCGNGIVTAGESCDDGNTVACDGCGRTCAAERCGDGVVCVTRGEACDDGDANSDTTADACRSDCTLPRCGDGVLDAAFGEDCDGGADAVTGSCYCCRTTLPDRHPRNPGSCSACHSSDGPTAPPVACESVSRDIPVCRCESLAIDAGAASRRRIGIPIARALEWAPAPALMQPREP
jgi:cysteine-rich repeat protein